MAEACKNSQLSTLPGVRKAIEMSQNASNGDRWTLDADREAVRQFIGVSFAGNDKVAGEPIFGWMIQRCTLTQEERVHLVRFVMSFELFEDLNRPSFQLCSQSPEDGSISSVASVQVEYNAEEKAQQWFPRLRSMWKETTTIMRLMIQNKEAIPEMLKSKERKNHMAELINKAGGRADGLMEKIKHLHLEHGPKGPHWYVHLVGVDPDCQGQGKGRAIMSKLHEMADAMDCAMYLEAGNNYPFYEKMGFVVVHTETLKDKSTENPDEDYFMRLMIRQPKAT